MSKGGGVDAPRAARLMIDALRAVWRGDDIAQALREVSAAAEAAGMTLPVAWGSVVASEAIKIEFSGCPSLELRSVGIQWQLWFGGCNIESFFSPATALAEARHRGWLR